jgi:hypothetical protein
VTPTEYAAEIAATRQGRPNTTPQRSRVDETKNENGPVREALGHHHPGRLMMDVDDVTHGVVAGVHEDDVTSYGLVLVMFRRSRQPSCEIAGYGMRFLSQLAIKGMAGLQSCFFLR